MITFICKVALNSLETLSTEELTELRKLAECYFDVAFNALCKAEGEERLNSYYRKQIMDAVKRNPVPFDNEYVHSIVHLEKHAGELDYELSKERWEYLVKSFGMAMKLSCQLTLEIQKYT